MKLFLSLVVLFVLNALMYLLFKALGVPGSAEAGLAGLLNYAMGGFVTGLFWGLVIMPWIERNVR